MNLRIMTRFNKITALVLILCMSMTFLTGCQLHKDEIYSAADGMLSSAKDGKMDKLSKYATEDVLISLGWDDSTVSGYTNQILAALTSNSDISQDELLENEEIVSAMDELVDTINANRLTDYTIDKDSVSEKDGKGHVTAKVTIQTQSAIEDCINDEEIKTEVESRVYDYMTQNMDSLKEYIDSGDMNTLYSKIVVAILPDVLTLIREKMSEVKGEEQTWNLTCGEVKDKWVVTKVSADE